MPINNFTRGFHCLRRMLEWHLERGCDVVFPISHTFRRYVTLYLIQRDKVSPFFLVTIHPPSKPPVYVHHPSIFILPSVCLSAYHLLICTESIIPHIHLSVHSSAVYPFFYHSIHSPIHVSIHPSFLPSFLPSILPSKKYDFVELGLSDLAQYFCLNFAKFEDGDAEMRRC